MISKEKISFFFKYLLFLSLFGLLFLSYTTSTTVNAMTINEKEIQVSEVINLKNVNVTIFEDGRVKPIDNPESLTKEERVSIMKLMNFSEDEIESLPERLINDILNDGGVKVEVNEEDFVHVYTDILGNDHIITSENQDEVNKIKERDLQFIDNKYKLNKDLVSTFTTTLKTVKDDIFTGSGILTYVGIKNNKEYEYLYRTTFNWQYMPNLTFVDTIASSWQSHTTSIATTKDYSRWAGGGFSHDSKIKLDRSSVAGTKATIDIQNAPGRHYGYIEDRVRIPVTKKGTTGQWASAYGHSWSPSLLGGVAINIGGYGSISLSGSGDKWSWKNSFTIGNSY